MDVHAEGCIEVRGARVHNLRDVDVDIPRGRLVVLTGVSGSGKSSLAFDTIYAEGQRRYVESLAGFARQYLDQLQPPDVDRVDGLPPTVAIDQKAGTASPRSTVATVTEVFDYLRLLYARAGIPHCPGCDRPIRRQSADQMVRSVLALRDGQKVLILAPLVRGRKGQHLDVFATIRREGLIRARVDGELVEITDDPPKLAKTKAHTIEAVVDRLVVREGIRPRLAESVDRALKLADGGIVLAVQDDAGGWDDRVLSVKFACPDCGIGLEELEPRTFSFNSPYGACRTCDGLGVTPAFDPELVLPDRSRSLATGAVAPWVTETKRGETPLDEPALAALLKRHKLTRATPLAKWPEAAVIGLLDGDAESGFAGVLKHLDAELKVVRSEKRRTALEAFQAPLVCAGCGGARLRPEARAVTIDGRAIHQVMAVPTHEARTFLESLRFEPPLDLVGPPLVREIGHRLSFLERVGLGYLTLDRPADTLSGGELQRVRLASQIGSGLVGVGYVLDEPTTGLHPRDTDRLLASLHALRDAGNSVLVVEHDDAVIRAADWVIDIGPGAGPDGGRVVAEGPPDALQGPDSVTARFLNSHARLAPADGARVAEAPGWVVLRGASAQNLRDVDVKFPLAALTCVTGVSGSGKSTLVQQVLARAVRRQLDGGGPRPGPYRVLEGVEQLAKLIDVDQSPIGRTPRSTPATYTGVFDEIRKVFAVTREAKLRGYKANRFSFNVQGGRCETCQGQGERRIEMQFLPDLYVTCESCNGLRFNRPTLEVRYKGHSIGSVLQLRVDEALPLFDAVPRVRAGLEALHDAGLGYVTLGQASTTLSGGEAQRVKLAAELGRPALGRTLYLLDEPTTGLHFADVANLLRVLRRLAELGHAVVVIEHNLDVIRTADWVIDLGPDGGADGGRVVAMGPPGEVARVAGSHTGQYLAALDPPSPSRQDRAARSL